MSCVLEKEKYLKLMRIEKFKNWNKKLISLDTIKWTISELMLFQKKLSRL